MLPRVGPRAQTLEKSSSLDGDVSPMDGGGGRITKDGENDGEDWAGDGGVSGTALVSLAFLSRLRVVVARLMTW